MPENRVAILCWCYIVLLCDYNFFLLSGTNGRKTVSLTGNALIDLDLCSVISCTASDTQYLSPGGTTHQ